MVERGGHGIWARPGGDEVFRDILQDTSSATCRKTSPAWLRFFPATSWMVSITLPWPALALPSGTLLMASTTHGRRRSCFLLSDRSYAFFKVIDPGGWNVDIWNVDMEMIKGVWVDFGLGVKIASWVNPTFEIPALAGRARCDALAIHFRRIKEGLKERDGDPTDGIDGRRLGHGEPSPNSNRR